MIEKHASRRGAACETGGRQQGPHPHRGLVMQVPHQDETVPGPLRESARVCSIVLRDDVGEGIAYSPDGVVTQRLASIMAKLLGAPPQPMLYPTLSPSPTTP